MDLSRYDAEYAAAEAPTGNYDELPDGTYHVLVHTVELGSTREAGDPILKWQLEVQTGPQAGRFLFRNNLFATPNNLKFLKKDLAVCGMTLTKLSELEDRLEELLDIELEVKKTTDKKGDKTYSNVYFQKRLTPVAAGKGNGSGPLNPDDLPF
jgi:Protein of unknown function (DUF669).